MGGASATNARTVGVTTCSCAGATFMVNDCVIEFPVASVAVRLNGKMPDKIGVPMIAMADEFWGAGAGGAGKIVCAGANSSPGGSKVLPSDHVTGRDFPVPGSTGPPNTPTSQSVCTSPLPMQM